MLRLPLALLSLLALLLALAGCGCGDGDESVELTAGDPVLLPSPPGTTMVEACDINDAGQIVGCSYPIDGPAGGPVMWTPQGNLHIMETLPGGDRWTPYSINNAGQVVGCYFTSDSKFSVAWTPGSGACRLPPPPPYEVAYVEAINDDGWLTGTVADAAGGHPARWLPDGEVQDLGTLPGCAGGARAIHLNNAGAVVGVAYEHQEVGSTVHAFRWAPGNGMQELPRLPGDPRAYPFKINDSGWVAGVSYRDDDHVRPVLWTPQGRLRQLPVLPGATVTVARDINNAGIAVGDAMGQDANGQTLSAVVWSPQGGIMTLPFPSGFYGAAAVAINNQNQVAGYVHSSAGGSSACRWSLSIR